MSLHKLKDDKSEKKWENGEKSSKRCDRKVVEKHRHISRSMRSRFSCIKARYGQKCFYTSIIAMNYVPL